MTLININPANRFALFGGGPVLVQLAMYLKSAGVSVHVFTSKRLAESTGTEATLAEQMAELNIPCNVTANIGNDVDATDIADGGGIGLSFGAPWIFKTSFIDLWDGRLFNSHPAPLPQHRGGGGYSWRILMNERRGETCVHVVTPGLDEGAIVWSKPYVFGEECLIPTDYETVAVSRDIVSLRELLGKLQNGTSLPLTAQNHSSSTYFPRLNTDIHGWINWTHTADDIVRFIRAFDQPYAGASTTVLGHDVRITGAHLADESLTFHPFQAGLIYRVSEGQYFIASNGGGIRISNITPYSTEHLLPQLGDRLVTPNVKLDAAFEIRTSYRP
jgi:methionyl-tRNA formyltransferase